MCLHVWKPDDRLSLRITGLSLVCSKHRPRTPPRQVLQVGQRCTYGFSHTPYEGEYLALISSEHLANVSVCVCVQHSYLLSKLEFSRKKHCESFAAFQRPGSVLLSYCEWHTCNVIAVFSLSPDSCVRLKFTGHFSFCCRSLSPHQHIHYSASEEKKTLHMDLFNSAEQALLLILICHQWNYELLLLRGLHLLLHSILKGSCSRPSS